MSSTDSNEVSKNSPYKSDRRATRQVRAVRGRPARQLTVRSEQRETPDVRKIARAIIAIALAEAEAERDAQGRRPDGQQGDSHD